MVEFTVNKSFFGQQDQAYIESQKSQVSLQEKESAIETPEEQSLENFDADWPKLIRLELDFKIVPVDSEEGKFVYHSKNFEFIADVRLSNSVIKRFGEIFEATLQYCQVLPISSMVAITHSTDRKKKIYLYSDTEEYYKSGGPQGSAGVYFSGRDIIMVGMEFLGLKKLGSGYTLDRDKSNKTLPHEIVHMFTDKEYYVAGSLGWFTEGLADYIAVTPYRGGTYNLSGNRKTITEYVTKYGEDGTGGRNIGEEFTMPAIEDYMLQPYRQFAQFPEPGNTNYGVATLMVYYFFHFEENGRENITHFLKALKQGKTGHDALKVLLNGRTYRELEKDIQKAWRSRGIKITFKQPAGG